MNIFDDLMDQVFDEYTDSEPTFESEFSSYFDMDDEIDFYAEEGNEITPEQVAEIKAKAKKIKKAIIAALAILATILIAHNFLSSKAQLKIKINKLQKELDKAKSDHSNTKADLAAKQKELDDLKEKYNNTKEAKDAAAEAKRKEKAAKVKDELASIKKQIDEEILEVKNEDFNTDIAKKAAKLFARAEKLIAISHNLGDYSSKIQQKYSRLEMHSLKVKRDDAVSRHESWKNARKGRKGAINALNNSMSDYTIAKGKKAGKNVGKYINPKTGKVIRESNEDGSITIFMSDDNYYKYLNFMETASEKCIESEISFYDLCDLTEKAIEKFNDGIIYESNEDSYIESDIPDEYTRVMDIISEKYANNDITVEEAVLLMEKAGDKYLDSCNDDENDTYKALESVLDDEDYDYDDDEDSMSESCYDEEYEQLVDAICEKLNNDEISADDAVLLLEKAADKYSIDYSSMDNTYNDDFTEGYMDDQKELDDQRRRFDREIGDIRRSRSALKKMNRYELRDLLEIGKKILRRATPREMEYSAGYYRNLKDDIKVLEDEIEDRR